MSILGVGKYETLYIVSVWGVYTGFVLKNCWFYSLLAVHCQYFHEFNNQHATHV
jgi:hypothetical protein